jgi:hypothetical protein
LRALEGRSDIEEMTMAKTASKTKRDAETSIYVEIPKSPEREVLYPLEPTSIPKEKIDAAIDAVMARRKAAAGK